MIKAIFANPVGRKTIATAMLVSSVIGASAKNLNNENVNNEFGSKTEFVNKETANAMKINAYKFSDAKVIQNKKVNKLYFDNCVPNSKPRDAKNELDELYSKFGANAVIIELQRRIDDNFVEKSIDEYFFVSDLDKNDDAVAKQVVSQFYGWKDNVFYKDLQDFANSFLGGTKVVSLDEAIAMIDKFIENPKFFTEREQEVYQDFSRNFVNKQKGKNKEQDKSDLLAHKTHVMNALAFNRFFIYENQMPKEGIFLYCFNKTFVYGEANVKP